MSRKAKVVNNPDLEKDLTTGVIINNNKTSLLNRKHLKRKQKQKDNELEEYKSLCNDLVQKLKKIEAKVSKLEKTQTSQET